MISPEVYIFSLSAIDFCVIVGTCQIPVAAIASFLRVAAFFTRRYFGIIVVFAVTSAGLGYGVTVRYTCVGEMLTFVA